jgi:hypothetical protein
VSTGWESGEFQRGPVADLKRKISTHLEEYNAVFRLVARHSIELYFATALCQQESGTNLHLSLEWSSLWSNISAVTIVINVTN